MSCTYPERHQELFRGGDRRPPDINPDKGRDRMGNRERVNITERCRDSDSGMYSMANK